MAGRERFLPSRRAKIPFIAVAPDTRIDGIAVGGASG